MPFKSARNVQSGSFPPGQNRDVPVLVILRGLTEPHETFWTKKNDTSPKPGVLVDVLDFTARRPEIVENVEWFGQHHDYFERELRSGELEPGDVVLIVFAEVPKKREQGTYISIVQPSPEDFADAERFEKDNPDMLAQLRSARLLPAPGNGARSFAAAEREAIPGDNRVASSRYRDEGRREAADDRAPRGGRPPREEPEYGTPARGPRQRATQQDRTERPAYGTPDREPRQRQAPAERDAWHPSEREVDDFQRRAQAPQPNEALLTRTRQQAPMSDDPLWIAETQRNEALRRRPVQQAMGDDPWATEATSAAETRRPRNDGPTERHYEQRERAPRQAPQGSPEEDDVFGS